MRKFHRIAAAVAVATSFSVGGAAPARADHFLTVCDNDSTGTKPFPGDVLGTLFVSVDSDETYVRYDDILIGVDTDPVTVCVRGLGPNQQFSLVPDAPPGYVGAGVNRCTWPDGEPGHTLPDCHWLLSVFVNRSAPLFSCVWVNGVQQLPGCGLR